jgi:cephalosporin-C deacetylase
MPLVDLPLAELETYKGSSPRPDDFDTYWETALAEMRGVDPKVELVPAKIQTSFAECFHLYFTGVRARACTRSTCARAGGRTPGPALLEFHGYSGHSGDFATKLGWVAAGFSVAALDVAVKAA